MKKPTPITDAISSLPLADSQLAFRFERLCRELETAKNENWEEVLDWERWAKEVCEDFRIPFDNHKVGLRVAITQWMAERKAAMPNVKSSHSPVEEK